MYLQVTQFNGVNIAELISQDFIIKTPQDALDIIGDCNYGDIPRLIINERNISPDFFELKTGLAGEVLQKFTNYKIRLAIVGEFGKYQSKSLNDFISESNRHHQICFVSDLFEAKNMLSKK